MLFGFSTGQMVAIGAKFLEETIPPNLYEIFSPLIIAGNAIGTNCAFLLGFTLPAQNDDDALAHSDKWRIFYAYLPVGLYLLFLLGCLFVSKYDTIKFLIIKKNYKEAILAIK